MNRTVYRWLGLVAVTFMQPWTANAGIFAPPAGQPGSTAISRNDPDFAAWAVAHQDYMAGLEVDAVFQTPEKALGFPGNSDGSGQGFVFDVVSLGRGGSITLRFSPGIANGPGYDFAVFENSITDTFLEFARVEVSSDGQNFVAFPAFSLVPAPVSGFGSVAATDVEQLAGKYRRGFGTPFDLQQLAGSPGLDLANVRYVRLVDVVGDGTTPNELTPQRLAAWLGLPLNQLPQALVDIVNAAPEVVYDPYPTVGSAGFDLDAVGVLQPALLDAPTVVNPFGAPTVDPGSTAVIPVVVYSARIAAGALDNFDPAGIDPASVGLGVLQARPVSGPFLVDWNADGLQDAAYTFATQDTGIACEDTTVELSGRLNSGLLFSGVAAISTPACPDAGCHP
ncbi:MAG: hypothetical protein V2J12_08600 [Gammaproteobacteria bacterium]|jgi:hypothetical protein|nr:hypothetical protein [Gammaproteobacteria bacterium]